MKFLLLISLFMFNLLAAPFAQNEINDAAFTDKFIKGIFSEFEELTGQNLVIKDIRADKHLKSAIYNLYFNGKKKKIPLYNEKTKERELKEVYIPNYREALVDLGKTDTLYSAWIGLSITHDRLMRFDSSAKYSRESLQNLVNRYHPRFLKILTNNKICYGYMLSIRYYKKYNKDMKKYLTNLKHGYSQCKNTDPKWVSQAILHEYVERKSYETLRKRRSK